MKEGEVTKATSKKEKEQVKAQEGDFYFWHCLTILTQSDESFDLVNQFDLMVA